MPVRHFAESKNPDFEKNSDPAADPGRGAQAAGDDDLVYADVDVLLKIL